MINSHHVLSTVARSTVLAWGLKSRDIVGYCCTSVGLYSVISLPNILVFSLWYSGGSRGRGAMAPRWRPENFFRQYINIITKPTAYDGPWEY